LYAFFFSVFLSALLLACVNRASTPSTSQEGGETTIATDAFPSDFPLSLSSVTISGKNATVEFTTGVDARVWIEFGKINFSENKRTLSATGKTHSITLTDLENGRYFFKLSAVSTDGKLTSAIGGDFASSFIISSASTISVTNIQTSITGYQVTLTFDTNVSAQAAVDVGLSAGTYTLLTESESGFQKNHTLVFSPTQTGTFYYRLRLVDGEGDEKTDDNSGVGFSFTLLNPEPLGSKLNPIAIDTTTLVPGTPLVYTNNSTTVGAPSNIIDGYAPYVTTGNHTGGEVIYTFTIATSATFSATLTGDNASVDNDVQLLTSLETDTNKKATLYNSSATFRGNTSIATQTINPGTYFVTVDAYKPSGGSIKSGPYGLTINLEAQAPVEGIAANPIVIPVGGVFTDNRNTVNAPSRIFNTYPGYAQNESGAEFIYTFTLTETKKVTATLSGMASGVDIDIHLLNSVTTPLNAANVLARDDISLTRELVAGTYYLVADTYVNTYGERKGAYTLTVNFAAVTLPTPGTPLTGGGTSGGADGAVTVTFDDTPPDIKALGQKLHPTRQLILDTARTYVGRISDLGGTGGFKLGWELLKDIYDTSYHTNIFSWGQTAVDGIKLPGKKINSWCGIFAVAMVRKANVDAANWQTGIGPKGIASSCKANDGKFTPGDILVMKGSLVHHNLFVSKKSDGTMVTIDGNQIYQTVKLRTNLKVSDVQCYYLPITEKYVPE